MFVERLRFDSVIHGKLLNALGCMMDSARLASKFVIQFKQAIKVERRVKCYLQTVRSALLVGCRMFDGSAAKRKTLHTCRIRKYLNNQSCERRLL
ncbi:hypothetical protein NPIL_183731 [Nephila pilipes]|uniref:Uncharacterized protein n=1 Tax=Nephila pilipes TaxID=299642 RepID=A0A8X6P162_NEPPI|nr:hypothetical protein NPIL_183731 [Nephila pilipes]